MNSVEVIRHRIYNYQDISKLGLEDATTVISPVGTPHNVYFIVTNMADLQGYYRAASFMHGHNAVFLTRLMTSNLVKNSFLHRDIQKDKSLRESLSLEGVCSV